MRFKIGDTVKFRLPGSTDGPLFSGTVVNVTTTASGKAMYKIRVQMGRDTEYINRFDWEVE